MRRSRWVLLSIAATVVALVFALHEGALEPPSPPNAAVALAPAAVPLVVPGEVSSPRAPEETIRQEQPQPEVVAPPSAAMLHVLVRDAGTHAPVPGARVEACPNTTLMRRLAGTGLHTPAGRRMRASLAIVAFADATGTAGLPVPEEPLMLEARSQELWGFAMLPVLPAERRTEIAIGPDRDLQVRVVDGNGGPRAGVPVAVRLQIEPSPRTQYSSQITESEPPDGVATFFHFQRRLRQGHGWNVTFAFPVRDPPCLSVDADTPREVPEPLVLPPTGALRIRVRNADGEVPYLEDCVLHVDVTADGVLLWPGGPWVSPPLDPSTGEVVLLFFGLDLKLQLELSRHGQAVASAIADGPRRPGEIVVSEVRFDRPAPRIAHGRFVRSDGRPWPSGTVHAQVVLEPQMPEQYLPGQDVPVTGDGRFVLLVHNARPVDGARRYYFDAPHPDGGGTVRATIALDQEVPREGLDLGDVVLDHGPLLVGGSVVDGRSQPLAGVQLQLYERGTTGERRGHVRVAGTDRTGPDGRFSLFLPAGERDPGDALVLMTFCKGFVDDSAREWRRGDSSVVVVLQQTSGLRGSFVLGNGLVAEDLFAFFRTGDSRQPAPLGALHDVDIHTDGTFTAEPLPPGPCMFLVNRRGSDGGLERTPALVVDGLQVIAGRIDSDPRLQQLRVEPAGVAVHIRVLAPGGAPLAGAVAAAAGAVGGGGGVAASDGVCRVRLPRLPADVEVQAYGYRSRVLAGVTGDCEVTLDHGIPVRLSAGVRGRGSAPAYHLVVHLFDVDASGKVGGMTAARTLPVAKRDFDADGYIDVVLPRAGTFAAKVYALAIVANGDRKVLELPLQPLPRFTVQEGISGQAFDLGVPQSAVDAVVAGVR